MEQKNKITLRQLYSLIDEKILNQDHNEALSYSQFLLERYPKNLIVHQLLAKIYLDIKQFDLALIFFEKILEIVPDDFVSHIGISIISESFGNLARALESMRRAYEIQPSNESLQNEVIRLIRQKDGFAPEKLRLTRGALIKMYSRSKLAEQAIAEAKLGVHESPDRIDYKIHMAEMLFENGNTEEAIEISLQILKDFPYCKPILHILFNCFSSSQDSTDSDLYRARLAELDPYFVFMKQDTEFVNNIPDIAIMIDLSLVSDHKIENIQSFLEESWDISQEESTWSVPSNTSDWQSIVDDAIANDGIGEPIDDANAAVEVKLENEAENQIETLPGPKLSKRDMFLKRISSPSESPDREPYTDDEIPDWILSYGALEKLPEDLSSDRSSGQERSSLQESEFAEDGMTDHAIPINPKISEEDFNSDPNEWKKIDDSTLADDETNQVNQGESKAKLEETQKIKLLKEDTDEILTQLETAFNDNDPEFSIQCLEELIAKEFKLDTLADLTEKFLKEHPTEIEMWLLLVRIYRKLELSEKALSALQNAQLNISI